DLLHFTGAFVLILFINELFCANELDKIMKLNAIVVINFVNIVYFLTTQNTQEYGRLLLIKIKKKLFDYFFRRIYKLFISKMILLTISDLHFH
ncbi:hypothetical protein, partial [Klebsiella pneumoniae]|uniref:hypothetical protein n=1 Tax=Klebsiella pneumoniae TaxID=573 RepID=UPI003854FCA8